MNNAPRRPISDEMPTTVASPATLPAQSSRRRKAQRRENWCILEAIRNCRLAPRAKLLDIPCGAGERAAMLVAEGYRVTAADASPAVVAEARCHWNQRIAEDPDLRYTVQFDQADAFDTGYGEAAFDAVICDQMLHRFADSFSRVALLAELARISREWVIVSFLNAATVQGAIRHFQTHLLRQTRTDHVPIMLSQLRRDAAAAGLTFSAMIATRGPISPLCYAVLRKPKLDA